MKQMTLQRQVTSLLAASLVLTTVAIGAGLIALGRQEASLAELITTSAGLRNHMTADMMHDALRSDVLAAQLAATDREREEARESLRDHAGEFVRALDDNEKLPLPASIRKLLGESRGELEQYLTSARSVAGENDTGAARARMPRFQERFEALEKANKQLSDQIQRSAVTARQTAGEELARSRWILGSSLALVVAFGLAVIVMVNRLIRSLRDKLSCLETGSQSAAAAAGEVQAGSRIVLDAAGERERSLAETAQVTREVREAAESNAVAGERAAEFMRSSHSGILVANRRLEEMVTAIGQIEDSSEGISKIIRVIDDIAFQTNILALNAAVEAARAGATGAGFAVVAEEVRRLAHRCSDAAGQTTALIRQSLDRSREGRAKVDAAAATIASVTRDATQVKALVDELNHRTGGQARGLSRLASVIGAMEEANRRTGAVMSETAAKAGRLGHEADALHGSCGDLARLTASC